MAQARARLERQFCSSAAWRFFFPRPQPRLGCNRLPPPLRKLFWRSIQPQSKVHWNVDSSLHTVHGTFNFKSGSIHFDPATGKAGGEIVVFASSGDSGNDSRDKRMHQEILETAKYSEVIFQPTLVEGRVASSGPSEVKLHGIFSIHGTDHELTAQVHAELAGDRWTGTGKFEVPYVTWGIKDPSNFFLKVKHVVNVELEMSGATKPAQTAP